MHRRDDLIPELDREDQARAFDALVSELTEQE
jgi:hypothetical protein